MNGTMSDHAALIGEARTVSAKATPGPWRWEEPSNETWPLYDESLVSEPTGDSVVAGWGYDASGTEAKDEDRVFIARARDLVPALADALEAAEARNAEAQAEVDELLVLRHPDQRHLTHE